MTGILLSLLLLFVLFPLNASAASPQPIDKLEVTGLEIPEVGKLVQMVDSEYLATPAGVPYRLVNMNAHWKDQAGYNIYGSTYRYEAGLSYHVTLNFDLTQPNLYNVNETTQFILTGVDSSAYTAKVKTSSSHNIVEVTYTFSMPGTYQPKPIDRIDILGYQIQEGVAPDNNPVMSYNHGYMVPVLWDGDWSPTAAGREFVGGNTYLLNLSIYDNQDVGFAPLEDITFTYNRQVYPATYEHIVNKSDSILKVYAQITVPECRTIQSLQTYGCPPPPVAGTNAAKFEPEEFTADYANGYYVLEFSDGWLNANGSLMSDEACFIAGQQYSFDIKYQLADPNKYRFSDTVTGVLHGIEKNLYQVYIKEQTVSTVTVRYTFTAQEPPKTAITSVNAYELDTPHPGALMDFGAHIYDPGYQVNQVRWYDCTLQTYIYAAAPTYEQNHIYQVEVDLAALEGFQFASYYDLTAAINQEQAQISNIANDGSTCTIWYEFSACQVGQLYNISVWNISGPETGKPGDYSATTGAHYHLNQDTNANGVFIENGIGWYDLTTYTYLQPGQTFQGGHQYQLELYLTPETGYRFNYHTITVNGQTASVHDVSTPAKAKLTQKYTVCTPQNGYGIHQVSLQDVEVPAPGNAADYKFRTADSTYFIPTNASTGRSDVRWFDSTTQQDLKYGDSFVEGHSYTLICYLKTAPGYWFTDQLSAQINGSSATHIHGSDKTSVLMHDFGECKNTTPSITPDGPSSDPTPPGGPSSDPSAPAVNPFTDVPANAFYYDAVLWAVQHGVTTGTSATTFTPDAPCTRAQAVTFLWRSIQSPTPANTPCPFRDVPGNAYYYNAVQYAVQHDITTGTSSTTFSPDQGCNRAQIVTFLWRLFGAPKSSASNPFTDVPSNAYYYDAVMWAVEKGITTGTTATTFSPDSICTRAQITTFLYRSMVSK